MLLCKVQQQPLLLKGVSDIFLYKRGLQVMYGALKEPFRLQGIVCSKILNVWV